MDNRQKLWEEWAELGWREFYPQVEAEAKIYLAQAHADHDSPLTTTDLVEGLWPASWDSPRRLRARVFKALTALETRGMAAWVTIGEPSRLKGGIMARRRRWHTPREISDATSVSGTTPADRT